MRHTPSPTTEQHRLVRLDQVLDRALAAAKPMQFDDTCKLSLAGAAPPLHLPPPIFEELHTSRLAARLQQSNPEYGYLLAMRACAHDYPNTAGVALRMRIVDGLTVDQIATRLRTTYKTVAPAISSALKDIMDDIAVPQDKKLRAQLVDSLSRFEVHKNLYPWHEWFNLWKRFPADVAAPPPISGLLREEIWKPMGLGANQALRGKTPQTTQSTRGSGLPKFAERTRFTVEPFTDRGFFGLAASITKRTTQF